MLEVYLDVKLNIVVLGNVVLQLYIYYVVCFNNDVVWLGFIWGKYLVIFYDLE